VAVKNFEDTYGVTADMKNMFLNMISEQCSKLRGQDVKSYIYSKAYFRDNNKITKDIDNHLIRFLGQFKRILPANSRPFLPFMATSMSVIDLENSLKSQKNEVLNANFLRIRTIYNLFIMNKHGDQNAYKRLVQSRWIG
jgi:hypothetical protein